MSKSPCSTLRPSRSRISASRTAPPTYHASCPAPLSFAAMSCTAAGTFVSAKRSATQHAAAVHVENLTRDLARERRAQKEDRPGDVVRRRHAPERDARLDARAPAIGER